MRCIDWEPFNGMAKHPWGMFWGLILCILIGLAGNILLYTACYTTQTEQTTQHTVTSFSDYSIHDEHLILQGEGRQYTIAYYEYYGNVFSDPSALCTGKFFSAYVGQQGFIYSLTDSDGYQYITFQSASEAYRNSQQYAMIIMPIALILTILYFVLAIIVSKNPEWSPKWLQYVLFKLGTI